MAIPFHSIKARKKRALDLHDILVSDAEATFFVRVAGDTFAQLDVHDGDILIVDRSGIEDPHRLYVAVVDGEFSLVTRQTVPRECELWGAVTYVIHKS